MSKSITTTIKELIDLGLTPEQAFKAAMRDAEKAAPAAKAKSAVNEKPVKTEKPEKKLTAKEAARAAAREAAGALDGTALIIGAKWKVTEGVNSTTGAPVWTAEPLERFDLAGFYAVRDVFSKTLDAGFYRGAFGVRFDPSHFLATGKLTDEQAAFVAEAQSARKAERDAKKAEREAKKSEREAKKKEKTA